MIEEKRKHVAKLPAREPRAYSGTKMCVSRSTLHGYIMRNRVSVDEAALALDLDKKAAERLLYERKPTQQHCHAAAEHYSKGFSLEESCVLAKLHPKYFAAALADFKKSRPKRHRTYYA